MPRNHYGSSLSLRFVGALVVFAIAALSGAVIGGVSVYIINDALTPPPSALASANKAPAAARAVPSSPSPSGVAATDADRPANAQAGAHLNAQGKPVRTVGPAFAPSAGSPVSPAPTEPQPALPPQSHPATVMQPSPAASEPAPQNNPPDAQTAQTDPAAAAAKPWPDALSRKPPAVPSMRAVGNTEPNTAVQSEERSPDVRKKMIEDRHKAASAKRRMMGPRHATTEAAGEAQSGSRRTFYDYYDRDDRERRDAASDVNGAARTQPNAQDPRARRSFSRSKERIIVRRQDDEPEARDDRSDDADRAVVPAQPRPARSFFGFFGGGRDHYDDWRDDDRD